MAQPDPSPFSLFCSCVAGVVVPRPGSPRTYIGLERVPSSNDLMWFPDRIVAIPVAEHARFRREYNRLLADHSITAAAAADWVAQEELRQEAEDAKRAPAAQE